jgi:uncharacterized protein (DUF1684 family)
MTITLALTLLLSQIPQTPQTPSVAPIRDTAEWRVHREGELKADRGWLSVSGLHWLKEGETTVGSRGDNTVRLADGPERFGVFVRTGPAVELRPEGGASRAVTSKDEPFRVGRTWIQFIKRGDLVGLRLWDPQNARKLAFPGLEWYEDQSKYKVRGRLIPSVEAAKVKIANVIGQVNDFESPGVVEFELDGQKLRLTPVYETPAKDELFYIFKDGTAGKTTYGAGRFVYSPLPDKDGNVVLDFNRAYSPPCAFTDFATCPLPPAQNRLAVSIEAGEKDPHKAP